MLKYIFKNAMSINGNCSFDSTKIKRSVKIIPVNRERFLFSLFFAMLINSMWPDKNVLRPKHAFCCKFLHEIIFCANITIRKMFYKFHATFQNISGYNEQKILVQKRVFGRLSYKRQNGL